MNELTMILLFFGLIVALFVFLMLRFFVLWYFRLDQIADDLHVIADHYRQQEKQSNTPKVPAQPAHRPPPPRQRSTTGLPVAR